MEMFTYNFMLRALISGISIALCAGLLGTTIVLRRQSMIGDGLSHVGFGSVAIATVLNIAPLSLALPVVSIAAFLLLKIAEKGKMPSDATLAMLATTSLAVGIVVLSFSVKKNVDINNYLFGSILAVSKTDSIISVALSALVIVAFVFCYNKIFALTFDQPFAEASGIKISFYNAILAVLVSITIVLGMKMMGALLISSTMILPTLASLRLFKNFKSVTLSSAFLAVIGFVIGLFTSFLLNMPTGASIVITNFLLFTLCFLASKVRKN